MRKIAKIIVLATAMTLSGTATEQACAQQTTDYEAIQNLIVGERLYRVSHRNAELARTGTVLCRGCTDTHLVATGRRVVVRGTGPDGGTDSHATPQRQPLQSAPHPLLYRYAPQGPRGIPLHHHARRHRERHGSSAHLVYATDLQGGKTGL